MMEAQFILLFLLAVAVSGAPFSKSRCITSCDNLPTGNYHSCQSCQHYLTCSHGSLIDRRSCPDGLFWNDNIKRCHYTSTSCPDDVRRSINDIWPAVNSAFHEKHHSPRKFNTNNIWQNVKRVGALSRDVRGDIPPWKCVSTCRGMPDGDYQSCNGCQVYISCSGGLFYDERTCPAGLQWDDYNKICTYRSPTCRPDEASASKVISQGTGCVSSCEGVRDGDYHSCHSCKVYASCVGGILYDDRACPPGTVWFDFPKRCHYWSSTCPFGDSDDDVSYEGFETGKCITSCEEGQHGNFQSCLGCKMYASCYQGHFIDSRPCPGGLSWDDSVKKCVYSSSTCRESASDDESQTRCVSNCEGLADGNYQSCTSCKMYVTCVAGILHLDRACAEGTVWDDNLKLCNHISTTCNKELPEGVTTRSPAASTHLPAVSTHPPAVSTHPTAASTHPPAFSTHPPATSSLSPVVSTHPPEVSTHLPAASTHPPTVSTHPPAASTQPPAGSTKPPVGSTENPAVSTHPPAVSTHPTAASTHPRATSSLSPVVSTHPPKISTQPPVVSTYPPVVSTHTPAVSTQPPAVSTYSPAASTQPPVVSTHPPAATTKPPAVSTHTPAVSTNPPAASTNPPTASTHQPSVSSQPPEVSSHPPAVSTHPPAVSTHSSAISSLSPVVSTHPSEVSTHLPAASTHPPTVSTHPPAASTQPPAGSTKPPIGSTENPAASTHPSIVPSQPPIVSTHPTVVSTHPPKVSTQPPVVSTHTPALSTQPPAVSTHPPAASTQPPAVSTHPPAASTEPPVVSTHPPAASTKPPTVSAHPPTGSTKPTAGSTEHTGASSHPPAASTQFPAASTQAPTGSTKLPAGSTEHTAVSSHPPAASTHPPVVSTQRPVVSSHLPGSTQPSAGSTRQSTSSPQPPRLSTQPKFTTGHPAASTKFPAMSTKMPVSTWPHIRTTTEGEGGKFSIKIRSNKRCVTSCQGLPDGDYQSCTSCTMYVSCNGGFAYLDRACALGTVWDDNLKGCHFTSTTCKDEPPTDKTSMKMKSPKEDDKTCVENCNGLPDGDYQSCTSCTMYVSCNGGFAYLDRACALGTVWDDNLKGCHFTSTTCKDEPPTDKTSMKMKSPKEDDKTCVENCNGLPDGDYQSCTSCTMYVSCNGGFAYLDRACASGTVWDDNLKGCHFTSKTCKDEPPANKTSMKMKSPKEDDKTCVENCNGLPDGDYQSCTSCTMYVSCNGGFAYLDRACALGTVWDDNLKGCHFTSTTCKEEVIKEAEAEGSNKCVSSCDGLKDGDYQSCTSCQMFVSCHRGNSYLDRPCAPGTVWDNNLKRCNFSSTTCH